MGSWRCINYCESTVMQIELEMKMEGLSEPESSAKHLGASELRKCKVTSCHNALVVTCDTV